MRKRFFTQSALVRGAPALGRAATAAGDAPAAEPEAEAAAPAQDPMAMMGALKQQMLIIVPQMASMGWESNGFVVGELPFSLAQRFKVMLQRGILVKSLDSSYVSSLSWYFLNMLGAFGAAHHQGRRCRLV